MGGLVAIILFALLQWRGNIEFRVHTEDRLSAIEAHLLALRAKAVASTPPDSDNQTEAKSVLAAAKRELISLPLPVVEQAGGNFIEASRNDPKAWDVALEFVAYRSSLNTPNRPSVAVESVQVSGETSYTRFDIPGKQHPTLVWSKPFVSAAQAARWDYIGKDLNKGTAIQPMWLFANGGATSLDGEHIRNLVFSNTEIHYSGLPVLLENVIFINCVFIFDNNDSGRRLSRTLLASANVNFQVSA
jgi:hypothetical protein